MSHRFELPVLGTVGGSRGMVAVGDRVHGTGLATDTKALAYLRGRLP